MSTGLKLLLMLSTVLVGASFYALIMAMWLYFTKSQPTRDAPWGKTLFIVIGFVCALWLVWVFAVGLFARSS